MQAAPVYQQQNGGHNGERIGGRRVIENTRDPFQRGQRDIAPDFDEDRPIPAPGRGDLAEVELRHGVQRREGHELKNGVGETEEDKRQPDAFEPQDTAQAVAQGEPDRIEKQDDEIADPNSQQRINSRDLL